MLAAGLLVGAASGVEPAAAVSERTAEQDLRPAITVDALDWDQCVSYGDGRALGTAPREALLALLGLTPEGTNRLWSTGPLAGEVRHFRIAFRTPVAVGTVCIVRQDQDATVACLRDGKDYPGDVSREDQWRSLPAAMVAPLAPGQSVRALRISYRVHNLPWDNATRPSQLDPLLLLQGRYWNPAEQGNSEWTDVAAEQSRMVRQWTGYWPVPLRITGLAVLGQAGASARVSAFPGTADEHPLAADAQRWVPMTNATFSGAASVAPFGGPAVKAVRVRLSAASSGPSAARPAILPLVALRADEAAPTGFLPDAPFRFAYDMPLDGFVAVRVSDDAGRDVRRLVAEVERPRGRVAEPWDLQDDAGVYVRPGKYHWRGIARPPLRLTYEITVYNAGHPPWLAPVAGGGWWMADHCPPRAVCAMKDRMLFGAQGAEFGIPLIATDLDGHKVWHCNQGVERLVSDGRYAYVVNDDAVVRFDPENSFARRELLAFSYTDEVPNRQEEWIQAEHSGAACAKGLLCVSYNAPERPWIESAFRAGEVDLRRCFPPPTGEKVHETAYTPAERILGTLLTITSSTQAQFGKATGTGPLAHLLLVALTKDVPVGSVMVPDGRVQVYALRAGQELPAAFRADAGAGSAGMLEGKADDELGGMALDENTDERFNEKTWLPLSAGGKAGATVAPAAEGGLTTRYLAFTSPDLSQLDYALVFNRRFRDAGPDAKLVVLEGQKAGVAGWVTARDAQHPISLGNSPTAAFVWPQPVAIRGCALIRPMLRAGIAFDVWQGPADAPVDAAAIHDDRNWRQVYRHTQNESDMKMSWHAHRVIHFDLGHVEEVRALRIRIVEAPSRGAPSSGGFESLVAFQPLGGDPPLPRRLNQRITVVALPQGPADSAKVLKHLALPQPGPLAFDGSGVLYAACTQGIVRIAGVETQENPVQMQTVIGPDQAPQPRALAFDRDGLLYVLSGKTKSVHVFDPRIGARVRTIGTPGGTPEGPWDPTRLTEPVAMAFDSAGKLWIVDQSFQPKRISRWSADGHFEQDFMGPTHYGGGGFVDPGDHTVVNHLGMKFRVDYTNRTWKLESILHTYETRGMFTPDRPLYFKGRRYLAGDQSVVIPFGDEGPTVTVCEEKDGRAVPLVAAGLLAGWTRFGGNAEVLQAHSTLDLANTSFVWCDLNRDGKAQTQEVQICPGRIFRSSAGIGDDLSVNFQGEDGVGWRLRPKQVRDDGMPVYDLASVEKVPTLGGACMATADGATFVMGHSFLDPVGQVMWSYPDQYMSVQSSYLTPWGFYERPPGVLCGGLCPAGHFRVGAEDLFCVNGNNGDYYAFTRDGLLAAAIVGGPRGYGRRFFSMPECVPGQTDLSDLRKTVEDFKGWICRAEDGKVYATVGKNHVTVVRVDGLEGMQRLSGTFEVTSADLQAASRWATERAGVERALRRPSIYQIPFMTRKPVIDGDTRTDWPLAAPLEIHTVRDAQGRVLESWQAVLAYDSDNLYVGARANEDSPLLNSAPPAEFKRIFQFGDGLDLQLGLDPHAEPNRQDPAPGDVRVVLTVVGDHPVAMLYRYKAGPGVAQGEPVKFTSPVGEITIATVRPLDEATIAFQRREKGWFLEAAIPWKALGTAGPTANVALRGDIGALVSDPHGVATVARYYWANTSHVVMSDLPSEAAILPSLWGEFRLAAGEAIEQILEDNSAAPSGPRLE